MKQKRQLLVLILISIIGLVFLFSCSSDSSKPKENTPAASQPSNPTPSDTTPPTFNGLSTATAVSSTQIDLSWTAATDDTSASTAIVYEICQSTTSGSCASTWTATYTTSAGATSYSVTGLTAATTYYFVVRAKDEAGNRDTNTVEKSATTSSDTTPPTVSSTSPTDGATNVAMNTSISITFSEAMTVSTVTTNTADTTCSGSIQVSSDNFSTCVQMNAAPSTSDNITFTVTPASALAASTTYKIKVTTSVKDAAGNAMASPYTSSTGFTTGSTSDTTPPTFSGLSTATAASSTQIDLSWTAATDDTSASTAIVYEICQSTTSGSCASTWKATYTTSAGATSYSVTGLTAATTYYFVVRAKDEAGNRDTNTVEQSATTYYAHTITIDGTNDFTANETFSTTSTGYTAYITWDDTYIYYGMSGTDVGSGSSTKWVLAYIGGSGGSTTGVTYNTQTPTLVFNAQWHIRWKANDSYTNAQVYSTSWTDAAWDFTGDVYHTGTYVEFRVPRADIGNPTTLQIHINMINEQSGGEWTYAGAPSTSFTDQYNPNYGKYFSCNLTNGSAPTTACTAM